MSYFAVEFGILCLVPVVIQAETTICKTDAVGIKRCKDSNGIETKYRTDAHGTVRSSDGTTYKTDAHGKWRSNTGNVCSKDSNGAIRCTN